MLIKYVTIPITASKSETFRSQGMSILSVQHANDLTALTTALNVLACTEEDGTPVAAKTSSGTQIAYAVDNDAAEFISTVGEDKVTAPLLQFEAVDASNVAKAQTAAVTLKVVLAKYLT